LRSVLADAVKQMNNQATFRLIDPSTKADLEVTNVSNETLAKIWEIIENERRWQEQRKAAEANAPANPPASPEPRGKKRTKP
jgi:hypothetical protein